MFQLSWPNVYHHALILCTRSRDGKIHKFADKVYFYFKPTKMCENAQYKCAQRSEMYLLNIVLFVVDMVVVQVSVVDGELMISRLE